MVTEGDVIVAQLPQADGGAKSRPVLLLKELPGFGDFLVCGISSQLQQPIDGWDLPIPAGTPEFEMSGLKRSSFVSAVPRSRMKSRLGRLPAPRVASLQDRLAAHLKTNHPT
jgi:mRNA interferase MazF